jgi:ADP-ribose pyrophosphatase YjhB (NUDIX family)
MQIHDVTRLSAAGDTSYDVVRFTIPGDVAAGSVGIMRCRTVSIILAYDLAGGYFVLADEPRVGANANVIRGVAGGTMEIPGEDPQLTAPRKLAEELGLRAGHWQLVASETYSSPGRTDEQAWLWLAEGLTKIGPADRCTTAVTIPLSELDAEIARYSGQLETPGKDLKTLALLLALKVKLSAA